MTLEDLKPTAAVRGILPDSAVTVVSVQWFGSEALELTYKTPTGKVANELLYRHDEPRLEIVEQGRPWSFDGDGALFRLVSEAQRIRLAHLFDPVLAVHTSLVDPLPHQITAVYESMLPRQPLRFLLADDPGAGKTIMAGLLIKELIARGDLQRCLIVCPGSLAEQWQDELYRRFHLPFDILTNDKLEAARSGNWFLENNLVIARLDKLSRNEDVQQKLQAPDARWDLIVCDEAHKMSASFYGFSGEITYTKRYRLGQLLSTLTRHFLLMTATPHNGKEEDFQLFMALLDGDRFEGRFRDGVHVADVSDLMRRMVKENLLKFDGTPLFPERIAYTVPYKLSDAEAQLYKAVSDYVREEFNRAEALQNDKRAGNVGFALTILQRRLASSPETIYQSLRRRRERLESRLRELEVLHRGGQTAPILAPSLPALDTEDIDNEVPNLGKFAACRRVARTVYLGSAPTTSAATRGLEDRRVKLGCVMPGESPAVFGDALRRLAAAATYLYQDGPRYWYSTQPTVTKMAEDRAEQLKRDPDRIVAELDKRLRADLTKKGDFTRVHPMPQSSADVPDDLDARLVVLSIDAPYSRDPSSAAESVARTILESRGNTPRLYRNTLVFLSADKTRLQELDEAVRRYLAWSSILDKGERDDLTAHQVRQAETRKAAADSAVTARLPETYQWLLVPVQETPQSPVTWQAMRLSGQDALVVRASKKLRSDELLITGFAPTRLRMELDRVPLWSGDHVAVTQLVEHFARYLYLPRLSEPHVLLGAISDGTGLMLWDRESFAFADSFDDIENRYRGLRGGERVSLVDANAPGLLVKPEVARRQIEAERPPDPSPDPGPGPGPDPDPGPGPGPGPIEPIPPVANQPKRYHGSVVLDQERVGRDASRIAEEVIAHLSGLVGAKVTVTLEVEAEIPSGAPDHVV